MTQNKNIGIKYPQKSMEILSEFDYKNAKVSNDNRPATGYVGEKKQTTSSEINNLIINTQELINNNFINGK